MTQNDQPIVHVVDDDPAVLRGLRLLIKSLGLNVETYASAEAFLQEYDAGRRGCLVLDVRMSGMSGPQLQQELRARGNCLPIIFITGHGDIPMAVDAMRSGAVDFIEKPFKDQLLLDRIQEALKKDLEERESRAEIGVIRARLASLTRKEREVLDLVVAGKINKEIAAMLGVTSKAIEARRARIMEKMQAGSVAELAQMALKAEAE